MEREELLLRRLNGQHLLEPVPPLEVAGDLCGLQAQFLRNAVHALRIRSDALSVEGLIKTWTLRGTVYLIPERDLSLYHRFCGTAEDVCESGWYAWTAQREQANAPETERRYARLAMEAIASGNDTREGLRSYLRQCGMSEAEEARLFNPWGGLISELAGIGALCFRVDLADSIRPVEEKRYRLLESFQPMEEAAARTELLRRYFCHYGPATLRDAAYFFRWTQTDIRQAMGKLMLEPVDVDGSRYYFFPADMPAYHMPEVILLAGFDPLMLGYRKEDNPFLPQEHLRGIFNLAGIVHPAILLRGRVVGRWKEKAGKAELTAFEMIKASDKRRIEREISRLYPVKKLIWT